MLVCLCLLLNALTRTRTAFLIEGHAMLGGELAQRRISYLFCSVNRMSALLGHTVMGRSLVPSARAEQCMTHYDALYMRRVLVAADCVAGGVSGTCHITGWRQIRLRLAV